ncbi:restriction endonuclease subunit S [Alteromonas stellipolaris]|uniref:restriction endonuclease subunit S n=1 Tax=Alteromonas stellipolaris TaxID=233316 RepID=UPI001DB844F3|nr:restriction endonuclease subunit S [Alteromonas stellipolaris]MBZ2161617.1 restriction endonuclease subunit S [Alteromonas stellipolaris]
MARNLIEDQIPGSWTYDLLDNLTERVSGHTPSKSYPEYWNGGIKWISLADSFRLDNGYVYETDKEISQEGINNSSAKLHPAETVVLSRDAGIGKSGVMAEPMAVSQHFIAWKCDNKEKMNSWFLYNWLQLHKSEFERQAVGSTIKTIGLPYFKKLKVAAPPYREQEKIAKILSTWDIAISTTKRLIENSKLQKKALIQQLLSGHMRLFDESGQPFSGHWKTIYLREILSEVKTRNRKNQVDRVLSVTNHSGFVLSEEQFSKRVASADVSNYKVIERGQFGYNPSRLNVGSFARLDEYEMGLLSPMYVIFEIDDLKLNSDYFLIWMGGNEARQRVVGSTQGSVRDSVKFNALGDFPFKLPSLEEQQKIASVIKNNMNEIKLLEHQLADLKQEKKALMQQLLTGKQRVKV